MSNFEFGYSQQDITPVYGQPLCGYFNPRPNKGAYDRLMVKAAVFRTGSEVAAIVSYDLCLLDSAFLRRIDEKLALIGSPLAGKTLYSATHTHTGPEIRRNIDAQKQAYIDEIIAKTVTALKEAAEDKAIQKMPKMLKNKRK